MLDHVIITVSNFKISTTFYTLALKALGLTLSIEYKGEGQHPDLNGFGNSTSAFFWLKEGKADSKSVHIGLVAKSHAEVDAFYKAAVAAGAKVIHAPRVFPEYYPGYYATWVLDPDGYEIEVVNKS